MTAGTASVIHAVRGPIVLITLGVLVAVDHFGGYGIGRTWPLLLIVFGLLTLLEKLLRHDSYIGPPTGPGTGNPTL
ncbi:MAG: hypothetical protein ABI165_22030 [Bryobacteraceae bacterium]